MWICVFLEITYFFKFLISRQVDATTHTLAKYLMELTIVEYDMAQLLPSEIAAAALCLSMKLLSEEPEWVCLCRWHFLWISPFNSYITQVCCFTERSSYLLVSVCPMYFSSSLEPVIPWYSVKRKRQIFCCWWRQSLERSAEQRYICWRFRKHLTTVLFRRSCSVNRQLTLRPLKNKKSPQIVGPRLSMCLQNF